MASTLLPTTARAAAAEWLSALNELKSHINGAITLSAAGISDHKLTIDANAASYTSSSAIQRSSLMPVRIRIDKRMKIISQGGLLMATMAALSALSSAAPAPTGYTLTQKDQHRVTVATPEAGPVDLEMTFCILFSDQAPKLENRPLAIAPSYNAPSWHNPSLKSGDGTIKQKSDDLSVGDGFDPSILKGSKTSRTADLFKSAPQVTLTATTSVPIATGFRFSFPEHPAFMLDASVVLPDPAAPPVLSYRFTPKKDGYYSVGYTGAPAHPLATVDEIWQPLIWQEKRFPPASFMELAYRCPVPTTLVTYQGVTLGIVVDPEEFSFDALPVTENSRFGVAVRNAKGLAQPMTFAPVLGLPSRK